MKLFLLNLLRAACEILVRVTNTDILAGKHNVHYWVLEKNVVSHLKNAHKGLGHKTT